MNKKKSKISLTFIKTDLINHGKMRGKKAGKINMTREFRILSIDGGGIRGIIPATLLASLEERVGQPLWKYFDLICGTSTGGIIALAIAAGKEMRSIQDLYDSKATNIFPPINRINLFARLGRLLKISFGDGGIYNSKILEALLKKEFCINGKDLVMSDSKVRLCIPSVNVTSGRITVLKTPHKVKYPKPEHFFGDAKKEMWVVARATSAAPAYFRTAKILDSFLVDGGLWANNPSLIGVIEARRCGFELNEIKVLSIGTGDSVFQVDETHAKNMRIFSWIPFGLLSLLLEVQSQAIHHQIRCILPPENYLRIQYCFQKNIALDDISRIGDLRAAAQCLFQTNGEEIERKYLSAFSTYDNYKEEK